MNKLQRHVLKSITELLLCDCRQVALFGTEPSEATMKLVDLAVQHGLVSTFISDSEPDPAPAYETVPKSGMKAPLRIGDKVMLNRQGLWVLNGPLTQEEIRAANGVMFVTNVGQEVSPGQWEVDVDGPLAKYMWSSDCFDKA